MTGYLATEPGTGIVHYVEDDRTECGLLAENWSSGVHVPRDLAVTCPGKCFALPGPVVDALWAENQKGKS